MRARKPGPSRGRPSKFDARRLELLQQAATMFAEAGYCGATMHDLAVRLGVTRPALYHYAPSKDALFEQCAAAAEDMLNRAVVTALQEPNGRLQVTAFFKRYAEICADEFGRCFVAIDVRAVPNALRQRISAARDRFLRAAASMFRRGVADGSICDCDPMLVSTLLFAAFDTASAHQDAARPQARAVFAEAVLSLFFAGLAPRTMPIGERSGLLHAAANWRDRG